MNSIFVSMYYRKSVIFYFRPSRSNRSSASFGFCSLTDTLFNAFSFWFHSNFLFMGGHGGLNILPQKKWHVYNHDNREVVRRDEEQYAREQEERRKKNLASESQFRISVLRKRKHGSSVSEQDNAVVDEGNTGNKDSRNLGDNDSEEELERKKTGKNESLNFFADLENKPDQRVNHEYDMDKRKEKAKYEKVLTKYLGDGSAELMKKEEQPFYLQKMSKDDLDLKSFLAAREKGKLLAAGDDHAVKSVARSGIRTAFRSTGSEEKKSNMKEKQTQQKDFLDPMRSMKEMMLKKKLLQNRIDPREIRSDSATMLPPSCASAKYHSQFKNYATRHD